MVYREEQLIYVAYSPTMVRFSAARASAPEESSVLGSISSSAPGLFTATPSYRIGGLLPLLLRRRCRFTRADLAARFGAHAQTVRRDCAGVCGGERGNGLGHRFSRKRAYSADGLGSVKQD